MVGTKGLPTALSQACCSDDSISFKSDEKKGYSCQVVVQGTVGFSMLIIFSLPVGTWKVKDRERDDLALPPK
jgi:hypothetical protein